MVVRRLVVLVVAGALLVPASVSFAVTPGGDGRIVFAFDTGPLEGIGTIEADGTDPLLLPSDEGVHDTDPAWSPDGTRIAYVRHREGSSTDIWLMDPDGSDRVAFTHNARSDGAPAWAPDGSALVFERRSLRHVSRLWVKPLDGSPAVRISPPRYAGHPDWSPDGAWIVFERRGGDLWLVEPDGTDPTRLTDTPALWESGPRWSPDGTLIAFSGQPADARADVYVMGADGAEVRQVTRTPGSFDIQPAWSPTGSRIVYVGQETALLVVAVVDGEPGLLIADALEPDWQSLT